jgi:hypothetical protein
MNKKDKSILKLISPVINVELNQIEFGLGLIIQDQKEIKASSKTGY